MIDEAAKELDSRLRQLTIIRTTAEDRQRVIAEVLQYIHAEGFEAAREAAIKACTDHRLRHPKERGWNDLNGAHRSAAISIERDICAMQPSPEGGAK